MTSIFFERKVHKEKTNFVIALFKLTDVAFVLFKRSKLVKYVFICYVSKKMIQK